MRLQYVNLILIAGGFALMVRTTLLCRKLAHLFRTSTYSIPVMTRVTEWIFTAHLYLFMLGFIVGFVDNLVREVEPIYTFIVFIFVIGTTFIYSNTNIQIHMVEMLKNKNLEILKTFINTVEMKDTYTKGHSEHVYKIVDLFYDHLDETHKKQIHKAKLLDAALLHDCGKISIRDNILNKKGKLSAEEWEIIRKHPEDGKKILDDTSFHEISDWVLYHHERMDGKGYYKLPGSEIPLESRIISVADTYSALITNRPYRGRITHDRAVEIMLSVAGTQLDEKLVQRFLRLKPDELEKIRPPQAAEAAENR